jgi:hypothetical protein
MHIYLIHRLKLALFNTSMLLPLLVQDLPPCRHIVTFPLHSTNHFQLVNTWSFWTILFFLCSSDHRIGPTISTPYTAPSSIYPLILVKCKHFFCYYLSVRVGYMQMKACGSYYSSER